MICLDKENKVFDQNYKKYILNLYHKNATATHPITIKRSPRETPKPISLVFILPFIYSIYFFKALFSSWKAFSYKLSSFIV